MDLFVHLMFLFLAMPLLITVSLPFIAIGMALKALTRPIEHLRSVWFFAGIVALYIVALLTAFIQHTFQ